MHLKFSIDEFPWSPQILRCPDKDTGFFHEWIWLGQINLINFCLYPTTKIFLEKLFDDLKSAKTFWKIAKNVISSTFALKNQHCNPIRYWKKIDIDKKSYCFKTVTNKALNDRWVWGKKKRGCSEMVAAAGSIHRLQVKKV